MNFGGARVERVARELLDRMSDAWDRLVRANSPGHRLGQAGDLASPHVGHRFSRARLEYFLREILDLATFSTCTQVHIDLRSKRI